MKFIVVGRESDLPLDYEGAVLIPGDWDDHHFRTSFELRFKLRQRKTHVIGSVRIAHVDMTVDEVPGFRRTIDRLPQQFESLNEGFFSLSEDDRYYEKLNVLGTSFKTAILTSLRDVAYNPDILRRVSGLQVFHASLIRDVVNPKAELERLNLITGGRDRVVNFHWTYTPPRPSGSGRDPLSLEFSAIPASLPPSNVHALIGRNGVGKTHMMRAMADGVASGKIEITQAPERAAQVAPNVVMVSFSAFDEELLPTSTSPRFTYIGLRDSEHPQRLKTSEELSEEFADSLATARIGARRTRWDQILATLKYQGSGLLDDFTGDLDSLLTEGSTDRFRVEAVGLFKPLSSGHKIALLTLTRLVEIVTERTIVFIDEPEAHLQPPLLSAFVRALSDFLSEVNGMAVVATHSPVVLQEVPASCVYKLRRYGGVLEAERPQMETYGENVSELTHEAFGLESTASGFYAALAKQVAEGRSYQEILGEFESLGSEARGLLRVLTLNRGTSPT